MFINPKKPSCTLNLNLVSISVNIYILGVILSFINTPTHTFASIHIARHTFAVFALNKGLSMSVVSRLLGHGSTDVTEKVYARFLPETLSSEVARLGGDFAALGIV